MKSTKKTIDREPEDDDALVVDPSPADELQAVLAELDSAAGGKVKVERKRTSDGRLEFVAKVEASLFSLEWLQEEHGGGEYRVTVMDAANRYKGSKTLLVSQPLKPAKPVAAAAPDGLEKLAAAIQEQQKVLTMLLLRGGAPGAAAPVDPEAMRRALLQDLVTMKQLFGDRGSSALDPSSLLELVKTGVELARDSGGGDGDSWARVVEKLVETAGPGLGDLATSAAGALRQYSAGAGQAPPPAAAPRPQLAPGATLPNPKPEKKMDLKAILNLAIDRAAAGADPMLYAEVIVDIAPDALLKPFLDGVTDGQGVVAKLALLDPRVNQHAEWFRDLGQAVLDALADDAIGPGGANPDHGPTGAPT